jgi:uroporphyrinogen III methyltransferase/synthase
MPDPEQPLADRRILVPPARPEMNPLGRMLERKGAEVLEFPLLTPAPPAGFDAMDRAVRQLRDFDWIVFSGSNCVKNFFRRLDTSGLGREAITAHKIAAIGHGAVSQLKKLGIEPDHIPKVHTAEGVVNGLPDIRGSRLLLVRIEGASRDLPEKLQSLGAKITEVAGYRMIVEANPERAEKVFGQRLDALALANPTAVRFLVTAAENLRIDLHRRLKGVPVATVGPATDKAVRSHGFNSDVVSEGHIADLAETLTDLLRR